MATVRITSLLFMLSAALVVLTAPAAADTFASAQWKFSTLGDFQTGPGAASIPLQGFNLADGTMVGSVAASAHAEYLTLGSAAAFSTMNTTPTIVTEALTRALAETMDVLTPHGLPAGTPGYLVYKATLTGTNAAMLSPTFAGDHIDGGAVYVQTGITGYRVPAEGAPPADGSPPGNYEYPVYPDPFMAAQYQGLPIELVFPIHFETPNAFYVLMTSLVNIQFTPTVAETFDGASSFLDTFAITALELQDENHQPVPGASLTAASGTAYPGVATATTTTLGGSTTTTTGGSGTTTTTMPGGACAGLVGLAHARCLIGGAVAGPLCTAAIPAPVSKALAARLGATSALLDRAIAATGRRQARLVKGIRRKLAALTARAEAATRSRNAGRRISAACGASIAQLASAAREDLP